MPPLVAAARATGGKFVKRAAVALPAKGKTGTGKRKVSRAMAVGMICMAVVFDAIQAVLILVPVIGEIFGMFTAILAAATFGVWFFLLRVNYFAGKKAGLKITAALGSTIVELIPIMDALPAITTGVVIIIIASWIEDKEGEEAPKEAKVIARYARLRSRTLMPAVEAK